MYEKKSKEKCPNCGEYLVDEPELCGCSKLVCKRCKGVVKRIMGTHRASEKKHRAYDIDKLVEAFEQALAESEIEARCARFEEDDVTPKPSLNLNTLSDKAIRYGAIKLNVVLSRILDAALKKGG
jgi:hypothetical protein